MAVTSEDNTIQNIFQQKVRYRFINFVENQRRAKIMWKFALELPNSLDKR